VGIDEHLAQHGFSVPQIFTDCAAHGLLLLEDFGSQNVGTLLDGGTLRTPFDDAALEILVLLHSMKEPPPFLLPRFNTRYFCDQLHIFLDEYFPKQLNREATSDERDDFCAAWETVLRPTERLPQCVVLRDFMPDNVMELPERVGVKRLGLLDFQDAGWGPIAYDVATWCEAVRRDTFHDLLEQFATRYYELTKPDVGLLSFLSTCHILAAQRHMRILGILTRMIKTGRADKAAYLPRVQAMLMRLLQHKGLTPVKIWMDECVSLHGI
jgi:aminoglycoside/choline kinase family phosphotransferase